MTPLFKTENLSKSFLLNNAVIHALKEVNIEIYPAETLSIVGESGCGKSTLGKLLVGLLPPTSGKIYFRDQDIAHFNRKQTLHWRKEIGVILQDPYASLNPRMTAEDSILEPLKVHKIASTHTIDSLLDLVQLPRSSKNRFPHEFSGGQRQRIAIARALCANPSFLLCDEAVSALDISVQAQIINLLKRLQHEMKLSYLFISHDLRLVCCLSDRTCVMYKGEVVELADTPTLYQSPQHPYTQALLSAIPLPDPILERERKPIVLRNEDNQSRSRGCPFAPRCPKASAICHEKAPLLKTLSSTHQVACHLVQSEPAAPSWHTPSNREVVS